MSDLHAHDMPRGLNTVVGMRAGHGYRLIECTVQRSQDPKVTKDCNELVTTLGSWKSSMIEKEVGSQGGEEGIVYWI